MVYVYGILLAIVTAAFVVSVVFLVRVLRQLQASLGNLEELVKTAENSLTPTLEELRETLRSVRRVTDNVGIVTEDVKVLTGSVRDVGQNLSEATKAVKEIASAPKIHGTSLKVGVRTALDVLAKGLLAKAKKK